MLDDLLGRGLSSKCKPYIKLISSRLELIKRKKNSTLRFLRKDVADLLSGGQEMKAFDRVDVLIAEQNISAAYEMIEEFCASILSNLSVIKKQRECPPESREAVASLMFAAARFADLPELRNLRSIFTERYGNILAYGAGDLQSAPDCFVNQEFSEKISSKPPSTEMKLKLMREISKESSIKWDSKDFEQRLANPHASPNDTGKKRLTGGCTKGDYVAEKTDSQDTLAQRKTPRPPEHRVDPNNARPEFHAETPQKPVTCAKIEPSVAHSGKPGSMGGDTIDAKNGCNKLPNRSDRISETLLNQSTERKGVWDGPPNRKDDHRGSSTDNEVLGGQGRKWETSGFGMCDERGFREITSYRRSKISLGHVTQELGDDAADNRGKKNYPSTKESTLDISKETEKKLHVVAYEIDDQEELPYRRKPSYGFERTTEKRGEDSIYERNHHGTSSHRSSQPPLGDDQDNLHHRNKPCCGHDETSKVHEDTWYEGGDHDLLPGRSQSPLDDDLQRVHMPHRSRNPRGYRGTRKTQEDIRYEGNGNDDLSDRIQMASSDNEGKVPHRMKPPHGYQGTKQTHQNERYEGNEDEICSSRGEIPLVDDQEKPRRNKPNYHSIAERMRGDTLYQGIDHETLSHRQSQSRLDDDQNKLLTGSKPPSVYDRKCAKMREHAYYDDDGTLSHKSLSPLEDDQEKLHHRTHNRSSKEMQEDIFYKGSSHGTLSHRSESPLDQEMLPRRSKPPYSRKQEKTHEDANYEGNCHDAMPRKNQSRLDEDENLSTHKSKPPYSRKKEKAHEDAYSEGIVQDTLPHKNQSPWGDDRNRLTHRSKPPNGYNRSADNMHEDAHCQGNGHQPYSCRSPLLLDDEEEELSCRNKPRGGHKRETAKIHEDANYQADDCQTWSRKSQLPLGDDQKRLSHRKRPPYGDERAVEMMNEEARYERDEYRHSLGDDRKRLPHQNSHYGRQGISEKMNEDPHYERIDYEPLSHQRPFPLNENQEKLTRRRKPPSSCDRSPEKMHEDTDYRGNDDEAPSYRSQSPSLYARAKDRSGDEVAYRKSKHNSSHRRESSVDYFTQFEEVDDRDMPLAGKDRKLSQDTERRKVSDSMNPSYMKNVKPPTYIIAKDHRSTNNFEDENGGPIFDEDGDYPRIMNTKGRDAAKSVKPDFSRIASPPYVISKSKSRNDAEAKCEEGSNREQDEFIEDGISNYRMQRTRVDRLADLEKQGDQPRRFEQHRYAAPEHDAILTNKPTKPKSVRQKYPQPTYVDTEFSDPLSQNGKEDAYGLSRMPSDQHRNGVTETGPSRKGDKEREYASHGGEDGSLVDKPRWHARSVHHHADAIEEETFIDELLIHYSKKETPQVANTVQAGTKPAPSGSVDGVASSSLDSSKRAGKNPQLESSLARYRAMSLPPEQPKPEERVKVHARAISLQPDIFDSNVARTHPKLPDYDDLAARFAALRRASNT